ncbi:hypothetical protein [Spirosoma validum]|uniref:Uncharacterized protein n=1 Tax=Spirosoma validum TaxID=2771355 RepID=A0A927GDJ6_9BACT|nr:hypothetical protein [Spirosoma validum]MBD2753743.1 hypothetical protein [Spirosoma validum]
MNTVPPNTPSSNAWQKLWNFIKPHIGPVIGGLIAIGAYSSDSILWQLFPHDEFNVSPMSGLFGTINGMNGLVQNPGSTESKVLVPSSCLIYVTIKNVSSSNQRIVGVGLECKNPVNEWEKLYCLQTHDGYYRLIENKKFQKFQLEGGNLMDTLGRAVLPPNAELSGWFIVASLKNARQSYHMDNFRLTINKGYGKYEYKELISYKPDNFAAQFGGMAMTALPDTVNLDACASCIIAPVDEVAPVYVK